MELTENIILPFSISLLIICFVKQRQVSKFMFRLMQI